MQQTYSPQTVKSGNREIKWIERIAYLLDEQFRIPGTRFRFGLDPLMNLIPFLGSMSGFIISGALVMTMAKNGASGKLVTLMMINIALDASIGAIPVIGNIFDFYYKANSRNIRLLSEHYVEGKHKGSGKNILFIAIVALILFAALILYGMWKLADLIFTKTQW